MKTTFTAFLVGASQVGGVALSSADEPLGKAVELISGLGSAITDSAQATDKAQEALVTWCAAASKTGNSDVNEARSKKEELEATIEKAGNDVESASLKIESFASAEQNAENQKLQGRLVSKQGKNGQKKAQAEGDLAHTVKDLANAQEFLDAVKGFCMRSAGDHEETVRARTEELKAIADAKKSLSDIIDKGSSLLMLSKKGLTGSHAQAHSANPINRKVSSMVSRLAYKQNSPQLIELANNMEAMIRLGAFTGSDPFVKIKGMLQDMLSKLQAAGANDATQKTFCDEQLKENNAMKSDLQNESDERKAKVDGDSAYTEELGESVKDLQAELATLAQSQGDIDAIRKDTETAHAAMKEVLQGGLQNVERTIAAVREYTAGGGNNIRDVLQNVESTITIHLTALNSEEEDSLSGHDQVTQAIASAKTLKEQDVKYMSREVISLEKHLTEANRDSGSTDAELSAVNNVDKSLKSQCIAKPDSYAERKRAREEELAGLKEALDMLESENEFSLIQRGRTTRPQAFLAVDMK
jgi:hypothetical protein